MLHVVRNTATSIAHLKELLVSHLKEHHGIDLVLSKFDLRFSRSRRSHNSPIGMSTDWSDRTEFPCFHGSIAGSISGGDIIQINWLSDIFPSRVRGINTCGGSGPLTSFDYQIVLFLADFPLLEKQYVEWVKFRNAHIEETAKNRAITEEAAIRAAEAIRADPDITAIQKKVDELNAQYKVLAAEIYARTCLIRAENAPTLFSEFSDAALPKDQRSMFGSVDNHNFY